MIDRELGSKHPNFEMIYPINYGYVEGIIAGDGEEQDCYILGVDYPVKEYRGTVIAIIKRLNDNEDKWVVSNTPFTREEIKKLTHFQEQYFEIEIIME